MRSPPQSGYKNLVIDEMKNKKARTETAAQLRLQAEKILLEKESALPENLETLTPEEIQRTLHELRVHQIELEMQNEELRRIQVELDTARAHYFDLYNLAPVGYCTISEQGLILQVNLTTAALLGVSRGALINKRISQFILKEDQDIFYLIHRQVIKTGTPLTCELRMANKNGSHFWARLKATVGKDLDGEIVLNIVIINENERKLAEGLQKESEERFRNMMDTAPVLVWMSGTDALCNYFNQPWLDFTGRTLKQEMGNGWAEGVHPADLKKCLDIYLGAFKDKQKFEMEYRLHRFDGEYRWLLDSGIPRFTPDGIFVGYIGSCLDITEFKQAEAALDAANFALETALSHEQELSRTDVLTGVSNRRHLFECAEHEVEVAARYRQPLSVIMFDLDRFKNVNDSFGHAVGDLMLQRVTQAACEELRSVDAIGRYGGEEFVILLPMTKAEQACPLAERIRTKVEKIRISTELGDATATLSIGIIEMDHAVKIETADSLIRRADAAMYSAKHAGRNRTVIGQK